MIEINTIILRHGFGEITSKGDTIWGDDCDPKEIKRWGIGQEAEAVAELAKHKCSYRASGLRSNGRKVIDADEWALEYCECDEDGDFIQGSDYNLARPEKVTLVPCEMPKVDSADGCDFSVAAKGLFGEEYVIRWKAIPGWTGDEDEPGACNWMAPSLAKNTRTGEDVTAICDVEDAHTW